MKTDNLVPITSRSPEERQAIASKGGHASTAVRRRKKTVKQIMLDMLYNYEVDEKTREDLIRFGVADEDICYMTAITMVLFKKAIAGDLDAIRTVVKYCGEDPDLKLKEEDLRIRKRDLKLKRELMQQQTIKLKKFNFGDTGDSWIMAYDPENNPILTVLKQVASVELEEYIQNGGDPDQDVEKWGKWLDRYADEKRISGQIMEKQQELKELKTATE